MKRLSENSFSRSKRSTPIPDDRTADRRSYEAADNVLASRSFHPFTIKDATYASSSRLFQAFCKQCSAYQARVSHRAESAGRIGTCSSSELSVSARLPRANEYAGVRMCMHLLNTLNSATSRRQLRPS